MALSSSERKSCRAIGHSLKPVVIIAQNGLSANVKQELDRALADHELIKVKVQVADREVRQRLVDTMVAELKAECIQTIGHMALLYREAEKPNPGLSNMRRRDGRR